MSSYSFFTTEQWKDMRHACSILAQHHKSKISSNIASISFQGGIVIQREGGKLNGNQEAVGEITILICLVQGKPWGSQL